MWVTQPRHLKYRDVGPVLWIIACTKIAYFVDRESSMNFQTDKDLLAWKEFVMVQPIITIILPLFACFFIESKMNRLYRLGRVHVMITNCLTAMVGVYFTVLVWQKPNKVTDTKLITAEVRATE